jgi:hypothetical protein
MKTPGHPSWGSLAFRVRFSTSEPRRRRTHCTTTCRRPQRYRKPYRCSQERRRSRRRQTDRMRAACCRRRKRRWIPSAFPQRPTLPGSSQDSFPVSSRSSTRSVLVVPSESAPGFGKTVRANGIPVSSEGGTILRDRLRPPSEARRTLPPVAGRWMHKRRMGTPRLGGHPFTVPWGPREGRVWIPQGPNNCKKELLFSIVETMARRWSTA